MRPTEKTRPFSDSVSSRVVQALRKAAAKKFSAFTLVELIVVITILAILATIGFLALSGYTQDARDASVKANVRSVYSAIAAESALTGNSPRFYVVHESGAALADGTVAFVDGSPVTLTGGKWDDPTANYSAGNPNWKELKLNPDKFKLSSLPSKLASVFGSAQAAYDPTLVSVWALDAALAPTAAGHSRSASFFQVTGVAPATKAVSVVGNFPSPTDAQVTSSGTVKGLVKASTGTGALVDGGTSGGSSGSSPSSPSSSGGPTNSCAADPGFANLGTLTVGSPASAGQAWTYSSTPGNCTYACLSGYSGTNCATAPNSCATALPPCNGTSCSLTYAPASVNQAWAKGSSSCGFACTNGYAGADCMTAPFVCGSTVGTNAYATIVWPDGKCWTKENMRHAPSAGNRWCYNNNETNCTNEGALYDWTAATSDLCTQLGTGWALPTDDQWTALTNAGAGDDGWKTPGNRLSGIVSNLPGDRNSFGTFGSQGSNGFWWSSTGYDASNAWARFLHSGNATVTTYTDDKALGFSVVCIKNN